MTLVVGNERIGPTRRRRRARWRARSTRPRCRRSWPGCGWRPPTGRPAPRRSNRSVTATWRAACRRSTTSTSPRARPPWCSPWQTSSSRRRSSGTTATAQRQAASGPGHGVSPRGRRRCRACRVGRRRGRVWSLSCGLVGAAPAGAATPARGRVLSSRCPTTEWADFDHAIDAEPRSTVRAVGRRRDGHQRRRPADVAAERLRHPGRRRAGGGQRLDRRPGLRGRRGRSGATAPATCSPPAPASRPATGWCTCRSPRPSTATTASSTAPRSACSVTSWRRAGIARGVVANGDGAGPEHARHAFLALAARRGGGADDQRRARCRGGQVDDGAVAARRRGTVRCPARPRPRWCARSATRGPPVRWCWSRAPTSCAPTSRRGSRRTSRRCRIRAHALGGRPTASSGGCSNTPTAPTW